MIEVRLKSWIGQDELDSKVGKVPGDGDYNLVVTGPTKLYGPRGGLLAVYLPGALRDALSEAWPVLSSIRLMTDNRGHAAGTPREQRGDQKRTRTRRILSATVGAVDPGPSTGRTTGRLPVCRLTAWTGKHLPEWLSLTPLFQQIAGHYRAQAPQRFAAQQRVADATNPDWLIPGTPFTTVTVNNTYSTGVHQDSGDLPEGFSTLAVARRGEYRGGRLVLARYRVAFDMRDGDLLIFDAHEWHGNTPGYCPHVDGQLARPCPEGCERVSLVTYFRTKVQGAGSRRPAAGQRRGRPAVTGPANELGVHVAIISTGRAANVPAMERWCAGLNPVWYVGVGEAQEYADAGATATAVGGALCASRNAALDDAGPYPCLQLSDDLTALGWATGTTRADVLPITLRESVGRMRDAMVDVGAQLAGAAPTANPYFSKQRVHTWAFVVGDMVLVAGGCPIRWDEGLPLKEDYDYTLRHIEAYGCVARVDQLMATFKHRSNPGGAVAVRTPELEQQAIARLTARWPGLIVPNPKRPNEVLLRRPKRTRA